MAHYGMPYTNYPSTALSSIHITSHDNYTETPLHLIDIHVYAYIQLFGGGRAMVVRCILLKGATCVIAVAVAPCKPCLVLSLMYINNAQQYLHPTVLTPNSTNAQKVPMPNCNYTQQYLYPTLQHFSITNI